LDVKEECLDVMPGPELLLMSLLYTRREARGTRRISLVQLLADTDVASHATLGPPQLGNVTSARRPHLGNIISAGP